MIQRAVGIVAPRLERLANLPAITVCPTGIEDQPVGMFGWEAIHHLQQLHGRARGMLGRTTRRFWIPGDCWACGARSVPLEDGPLYRSEPRQYDDPMQVSCARCGRYRPYADYEHFQTNLQWPIQPVGQHVQAAA